MTFDEILAQIIDLLKRQGRVSYSALKRRFDLDDDYLNDLRDELLFAHPVVDEDNLFHRQPSFSSVPFCVILALIERKKPRERRVIYDLR